MITHKPPRPYPVPNHEDLFSCYDWHPGMPDNIILRMSKSSLGESTFCAQQYGLKRIIGMKEPQNDNMLRGTNVHDAVEGFYDRVDIEKAHEAAQWENEGDLDTYFRQCFPTSKEIRSAQDSFFLDEDLHIDRFRVKEVDRFLSSDPEHFLPTGNEMEIDCVVEITVDGEPQRIHINGFIDRIYTNPDGTLHIHELKTGAWKEANYKYESMRKEMAFYVWALRKADPSAQITHWGWDHTKGVKGTDTEDAEMFRLVEAVRVKELGLMMADMQNLVRMHRRYKGDGDISMFPLIAPGRQYSICDPWCALKEFCPRYQTHLE